MMKAISRQFVQSFIATIYLYVSRFDEAHEMIWNDRIMKVKR